MRKLLLSCILVLASAATAWAWNDDLSVNTQVTPTGLSYDDYDLKTSADGVTYILMLCPGTPESMRLQIMDADGNRLLPRAGQLVSQEPNNTWFGYNQYVELDPQGNAFVGVEDYRKHVDEKLFTVTIYKYSADGTKLLDGVTLNGGKGYKLSSGLSMSATADGGCVCAFNGTDDTENADYVIAEKIDSEGKTLWSKTLYKTSAFSNPLPFITDADNGRKLVLLAVNSEIKANIIEADGSLAWTDFKTVYNGGFASPKTWEALQVEEAGGNKTLVSLSDASYTGRVLLINGDGSVALDGSSQGVDAGGNSQYASGVPAAVYNKEDGSVTAACKLYNQDYSTEQSLIVRKINSDGSKAWTSDVELVPSQQDYQYGYCVMRPATEGRNALFYMKMDNTNSNDVKAYMQLLGKDGKPEGDPVAFATAEASKQTLRVSALTNGQYLAAWDEKRNGSMSIYMQNIKPDSPTGINKLENSASTAERDEYFTPDGTRLSRPAKGLNIIRRTTQGKAVTVKVMK